MKEDVWKSTLFKNEVEVFNLLLCKFGFQIKHFSSSCRIHIKFYDAALHTVILMPPWKYYLSRTPILKIMPAISQNTETSDGLL